MTAAWDVRAGQLLGLCNMVAGALCLWTPAVLGPLAGASSPAGLLVTRLLGVFLCATGTGFLLVRGAALRVYLMVFGVATKIGAAALLAGAALTYRSGWLTAGAAADLVLALIAGLAVSASRHVRPAR